MKFALIQTCTPASHQSALDHLIPLIERAVEQGAVLIATPEGTNCLQKDREKLLPALHKMETDLVVQYLGRFARERHVEILIGSALVRNEQGLPVNRCIFLGSDGQIAATYDKIHMFDVDLPTGEVIRESATYQPGDRAVLARTRLGLAGLSICYDLRFPYLYRKLAKAGAEILFVPAAFTKPTGQAHWEILLRARAIETGSFVLAPAQVGRHEDGRSTFGHSLIIAPWGEILGQLDGQSPDILLGELDLDLVKKARHAIPALCHDRSFLGPEPVSAQPVEARAKDS